MQCSSTKFQSDEEIVSINYGARIQITLPELKNHIIPLIDSLVRHVPSSGVHFRYFRVFVTIRYIFSSIRYFLLVTLYLLQIRISMNFK